MRADHRSAHPNIAGIPWWGAILTALVATVIGFAFDAGSGGGQLTTVFSTLYVLGCLIAVLAVQQRGLFTAVIQPPLVLFVTVPSAYFLMRSGEIEGLKDILINCGYPLIERFPLMFFTSAAVLVIGLARWYFASARRSTASEEPADRATPDTGGLSAKLSALFGGRHDEPAGDADPKERRATARRRVQQPKPAAGKPARGGRPTKRATPTARHSRAPETEIIDPILDNRGDERPRRRRERPIDEFPPEPRRRPRPPREPRDPSSREPRDPMPPRERRTRYDRDDLYERPRRERPQRRSRPDDYEPFDPYGSTGSSSHHPISRVRYRGEDSEGRTEYRTRRRAPRDPNGADRWEYDI